MSNPVAINEHGHETIATSYARGEWRLRCSCGWTNLFYITKPDVPDWLYAHLDTHGPDTETRDIVNMGHYYPKRVREDPDD